MSPVFVSKAIYFISGRTQQLVWPYIVSGLKVAATKNTGLPSNSLNAKFRISNLKKWKNKHNLTKSTHVRLLGNGWSNFSLIKVYS